MRDYLVGSCFIILGVTGIASATDYPRNQSHYVSMPDGVRIAVDVWLPDTLARGERLPTLMQATRYWRAIDVTDGRLDADKFFETAEKVNGAGYALVTVDARGSGASFGSRAYERSAQEARDYGDVVDWIVEQPWSDGVVGAFGISYAGNTAELLLVNQHPAVKAVAPLFNDFDNFSHLAFPGGAMEAGALERWSYRNDRLDSNDYCGYREVVGDACDQLLSEASGVKPVDADVDRQLVARAIADHANNVRYYEAALAYEFRDDPWGSGGVPDAGRKGSPAGYLEPIEASGVPMFIRAGWQDAATVAGTVGRYNTIDNVQQVFIGPWDHGARRDADPFRPENTPVSPTPDEQWSQMLEFFDRYLKPGGEPVRSSITYYTLGADRWTTTDAWPPAGFEVTRWYLGVDGSLSTQWRPVQAGAIDYRVDFDATTGRQNRWYTNNGGGGDVVYGDRSDADRKLLTFTSAPVMIDTEITGHPIITLFVTSTNEDGLFIAYLEDVAPDGGVTYITEGQLRAVHRRVSEVEPEYWIAGPHRSRLRSDAMPLVPGEVAKIEFELWPTSALIRAGHRIRIAIAGADSDTFLRYPRDGSQPTITFFSDQARPSQVLLPIARKQKSAE